MFLRIVRGQPQSGQVDEIAKRWEGFVAPRLRAVPGFRHAYFVGNREQNTALGVTLWDQLPELATMGQTMQAFQEQVKDISAGPPTIEDYEVLVEI